jgi:hypothetical protein
MVVPFVMMMSRLTRLSSSSVFISHHQGGLYLLSIDSAVSALKSAAVELDPPPPMRSMQSMCH